MSQSRLLGAAFAAVALIFSTGLYLFVPLDVLSGWIREDGFFELGSAAGWFLLAATCAYYAFSTSSRTMYALSGLISLLLGMRELDFHKAFTADSLLKTNYYRHTPAPIGEKLVAATVVIAIAVLVVYFVIRYGPGLVKRLRQRHAAAITLATGVAVLAFTKVVDRSISVLKDEMHLAVAEWQQHLQAAFEEPLEFFVPLILLLAAYQHARREGRHGFSSQASAKAGR